MLCNHKLVEGFGCMGDAVVCCLCGLDKYPEAIPVAYDAAKLQGRVVKESDPEWPELFAKANEARANKEHHE